MLRHAWVCQCGVNLRFCSETTCSDVCVCSLMAMLLVKECGCWKHMPHKDIRTLSDRSNYGFFAQRRLNKSWNQFAKQKVILNYTWINVHHNKGKRNKMTLWGHNCTFQIRTSLLLNRSEHRQRKFRVVWTCCTNACPSPTIRPISNKHTCSTRNWKHPHFSIVWPMQNNGSYMALNGAFDRAGHNKWFMITCCCEVNVKNKIRVSVMIVFLWTI